MKLAAKSGASLAAAAAALVLAGAVSAPAAFAGDKGHCVGANACKGTSACKTANSACKGQNACKGTGWTESSKADCDAAAKANKDAKVKITYEEAKK